MHLALLFFIRTCILAELMNNIFNQELDGADARKKTVAEATV